MKTKRLLGGLILASALTIGILFACKKSNTVNTTVNPASEISSTGASQRPANAGTQTYYSTNGSGTYYKLTLTWDANGNAVANRVTTTSYPAGTVKNGSLEEGIVYTQNGNITTISPPAGTKYFFIPYNPSEPLNSTNGGDTYVVECQKQCTDAQSTCYELLIWNSVTKIFTVECPGSCNRCVLMAYKCTGGNTSNRVVIGTSGGVIVEANNVTE